MRRRRLGAELRRLREAAGITPDEARTRLGCSPSKISRIELGRSPTTPRDVTDLLELYQVTDPGTVTALTALARQSNERGWWQSWGDLLPDWFGGYIGLETEASAISAYETQLVPGLLQTPGYAAAVLAAGIPRRSESDVARQVQLRTQRQRLLTRDTPPNVWAVLDEAVLRRPIGGTDVLRAQLLHLADQAQLPALTLQVLPFDAGAHPALGTGFTILRFDAGAGDEDVVYIEALDSAIYVERPADVRRYVARMDLIRAIALRPQQSLEMIRKVADDLG
ncbi:helix-turn-helix domain-containing protein [Parafrankia irregularis]|uniref:helix-turn-helix domain-containing protein n=1 Tax=Parafrankia irregularis TaxID=795642 RepID=UPI000B86A02D|nr:helix-turn-helix transcriptional regulator [Parafrankia irregularis]MBE3206655.1 helix-turn-helix domain-containing protein [Parafrankia sp. CH37]